MYLPGRDVQNYMTYMKQMSDCELFLEIAVINNILYISILIFNSFQLI